jgi:CTP:molybdopterin cytidylyltransferase MocA
MNRLRLTPQACADLKALSPIEMSVMRQVLNQLQIDPARGLKLLGPDELSLWRMAGEGGVVYRFTGGEIQVVSLKSESITTAPQHLHLAAVVLAGGHTAYADTLPFCSMVDSFLDAGIDDLILVVGDHAESARQELQHKEVTLVVNPEYDNCLSRSLRYGLKMLAPGTRAVMLSLGNRPYVTSEIVRRLIRAFKTNNSPVIAPSHAQMRGHPVLFDTCLLPELLRAHGSMGGRCVIERHAQEMTRIEIDDASILEKVWAN